MLDFIIKYWVEFALGIIATGLGVACKRILNLYKKEKEHEKTEEKNQLLEEMKDMMTSCQLDLINKILPHEVALKEEDKKLNQDITHLNENVDILKGGMLSLQGREFKQDCRELLKEDHVITLIEYETIVDEHKVYNSLGGNHRGDALFAAVQQKYNNSL